MNCLPSLHGAAHDREQGASHLPISLPAGFAQEDSSVGGGRKEQSLSGSFWKLSYLNQGRVQKPLDLTIICHQQSPQFRRIHLTQSQLSKASDFFRVFVGSNTDSHTGALPTSRSSNLPFTLVPLPLLSFSISFPCIIFPPSSHTGNDLIFMCLLTVPINTGASSA